jgi:hypothetical protein
MSKVHPKEKVNVLEIAIIGPAYCMVKSEPITHFH